jgi:hypothetical protein
LASENYFVGLPEKFTSPASKNGASISEKRE